MTKRVTWKHGGAGVHLGTVAGADRSYRIDGGWALDPEFGRRQFRYGLSALDSEGVSVGSQSFRTLREAKLEAEACEASLAESHA